ncbi:gliding motility-associated C-terminal domain-containing protein [bacterium]|nr:gliding motility-associated C-terminal domain-containing protein [bacterium]
MPDYCAANEIPSPICWSIFIDDNGPDAWPINPQNGDYVACDSGEQSIAIYLYDELGVILDSIEISVNGTTFEFGCSGLSFGDTILSYTPLSPWRDGDTVEVQLLRAPDSLDNPVAPISYSFYMDLSPPELYSISPSSGDTIPSRGSTIRAGLTDRGSGLDTSSIYFTVDGADFHIGDAPWPVWIAAESTAVLDLRSLGIDLADGETVEVCIGASDAPDWCDANEAMTCFHYFVDGEGPTALLESPDSGACSACSLQGFRALISDASMIDDTTFIFRANGKIYTTDSAGVVFSTIGRRIYFVPSEPWADGTIVHIDSFYVADILGNWGEDLLDFEVHIDLSPPIVFGMEPPDGGVATRSSPIVSFVIADSGCGVDPSTIRFTVDGEPLSLDSSGVHYSPDTIRFDTGEHGLSYDDGDTVRICVIGAADEASYCSPNWIASPICWGFTINTAGPMAESISPDSGSYIACDSADQEILIFLADPDGVNISSISLAVDGTDYTIDSAGLDYIRSTSTLRFAPSEPWADGDTIDVLLTSAEDSLGNGLASPLGFSFFIDLSPPETTFVNPVVGLAIHPGPAHISVGIEDRGAGIVDGSLGIGIGGVWHDVGSAGVFWDGDSLVYDGSAIGDTIFAGDTVLICVRGEDSTGLCGPNEMLTCWNYITTSNGPFAEPRFPAMGAVTSCADSGVYIFLLDSDGDVIVPPSFVIVIDDTFVIHGTAWPDVFYDYGDTTLYVNVGPHDHGDTVRVTLLEAMDIYHSPLTSPLELWFVIDTIGPELLAGWPPLGGMIAPSSPDIAFYCDDFPAGIDHGLGNISIWGHDYDLGSGIVWHGDTIVLPGSVYSADTTLEDGDSVLITVTLYDSAQYCGANVSVVEWWFTVGITPPEATIESPENGAITSCDGGEIRIIMTDDDGLLYDSCGVVIEGEAHYPSDPNLYFHGDTLIYNAPGEFSHGDMIAFWPVAQDIYGARLDPVDSFAFIVDLEPPIGSDEGPADGSEILDWKAAVEIALEDVPAGVDSAALTMTITTPRWTRTFAPGSLDVSWDGSRFVLDVAAFDGGTAWTPALDGSLIFWHERETIYVEVHAADTACCCGANDTTYSWSFSVLDDDTVGPSFSNFSPTAFWSGIAANVGVTISDPSGVFDDATDLGGQGVYLIWDSDGSLSNGGESIVQMDRTTGDQFATVAPIGPFAAGDSPIFCISAFDNDFDFMEIEDRAKAISDSVRPELIIGQGPIAELLYPAHGSYSSCDDGRIEILLTDPEGVVDSSIELVVDYDTIAVGSNMAYRNDTLVYNIAEPFADGELVTIRLIAAEDALGYGLDSALIWHYWIDTSPPEIEIHDYRPIVPPDRDATIEWRIDDLGAGVDDTLILIYIDGDTLRLPSSSASFDGEFLSFDPESAGYDISESMSVCVSACDLAEYCGANCSDPICVVVRRSKETGCDAWPIPFTPNGDGANDVVWFEYPSMELEAATVEIFDIEGRKLFSADYPATPPEGYAFWDGMRSAGKRARPGTYIYVVMRGGEVICKGSLVLVR